MRHLSFDFAVNEDTVLDISLDFLVQTPLKSGNKVNCASCVPRKPLACLASYLFFASPAVLGHAGTPCMGWRGYVLLRHHVSWCLNVVNRGQELLPEREGKPSPSWLQAPSLASIHVPCVTLNSPIDLLKFQLLLDGFDLWALMSLCLSSLTWIMAPEVAPFWVASPSSPDPWVPTL